MLNGSFIIPSRPLVTAVFSLPHGNSSSPFPLGEEPENMRLNRAIMPTVWFSPCAATRVQSRRLYHTDSSGNFFIFSLLISYSEQKHLLTCFPFFFLGWKQGLDLFKCFVYSPILVFHSHTRIPLLVSFNSHKTGERREKKAIKPPAARQHGHLGRAKEPLRRKKKCAYLSYFFQGERGKENFHLLNKESI